jgi:hypothetical protein
MLTARGGSGVGAAVGAAVDDATAAFPRVSTLPRDIRW